MKAKSKAFCEKASSKRTKQKRCEYIGKGNCCKIDGDYCRGYNLYDKMHGVCTRKNCYEQGKKEQALYCETLLKDLEEKTRKLRDTAPINQAGMIKFLLQEIKRYRKELSKDDIKECR